MCIDIVIPYIFYRSHETSLRKLRKSLSDSSKNMRHRRHLINIHIAVLGWITELSTFLVLILGSFILGHGNTLVTMILQTITYFLYFNLLPCIYLINGDDLKDSLVESSYYLTFLKLFNCENVHPRFLGRKDDNDNDSESNNG